MEILERIKLGEHIFFIKSEVCYKYKDNITRLCLKNYKDDYYDGGDLHLLITKLEENYEKNIKERVNGPIFFLDDAVYIYDNIPFISGVGEYYVSSKDNNIYSASYISKEEIEEYIKNNNIKMKDNSKFELWNGFTWNVK